MTVCEHSRGDVLLQVDHVSLSFGDRVVLRDVNAEIRDICRPGQICGQVVCFLGPSGIGKTQFSRVIAGLQVPTSGRVLLRDDSVSPYSMRRNLLSFPGAETRPGWVGMVPQNYPLFEFATVLENLSLAGKQGGLSAFQIHDKAFRLMNDLGVSDYRDMYPWQLSGGTRQRVAIIRQLMCTGHYLVLDEPFSGLDPLMKRKASELITQVANLDERNTIILVTHDVTEGMMVADTVWLMGRDFGQPGARLVDQYDLADMGMCWREDLGSDPQFLTLVADIKARFASLVQPVVEVVA